MTDMGWRDRDYNRNGYGSGGPMNPLTWLLTGSVHIGTLSGIRIKVHASMILFIGLTLLFGPGSYRGYDWIDALTSMAMLFGIVLLHEFGHCFAARSVGGDAEEIMMSPLGGLAFANAPHAPWPQFVTVAGGPLVNVAICLLTGAALFVMTGGVVPLNPFWLIPPEQIDYASVAYYFWWVYVVSYVLLLFNLLPIYPLDGGQLLQAVLWPRLGYFRSMMFSCNTGVIGGVLLGLYGLARGNGMLFFIAIFGVIHCHQRKAMLKAMGPEGLHDAIDYSASLRNDAPRAKRLSRRAQKKIQRVAQEERAEQARIDAILEKVSTHGMHSLSWWEKRTLRKATERQRQRDLELTRRGGY